MNLINLTPHDLNICDADGVVVATIPASGVVARVTSTADVVGSVDVGGHRVDLVATKFGDVDGLPAPAPDTLYIVSSLVLQAVSGRTDVVAPDTGPASAVRDDAGRIVGVRRFQTIS